MNDFHLRMDSKLDRQVEQECVLRRTSKNQLITGIVQRALNPNPDDEATIFRRLDRVEKSLVELEKTVRSLLQQGKTFHTEQRALHEEEQTMYENVRQSALTAQAATKALHSHLVNHVDQLAEQQAQRYENFLQRLVQHAAQEGRGFLRKLGEGFSNSRNGSAS